MTDLATILSTAHRRWLKPVAAIGLALVAIAGSWSYFGWPVPAMRDYVDDRLEKITKPLTLVRVDVMDLRVGQIDREVFDIDKELAQATTTPTVRQLLTTRKSKLLDTRASLVGRLRALRDEHESYARAFSETLRY